jgi:hypothetical protein
LIEDGLTINSVKCDGDKAGLTVSLSIEDSAILGKHIILNGSPFSFARLAPFNIYLDSESDSAFRGDIVFRTV